MMKLTLAFTCTSYSQSCELQKHLKDQGFNVILSSPQNHIYQIIISSTPETVNIGETVFDELEAAEREIDIFISHAQKENN